MPTLKKYLKEDGIQFINHVAAYPVCGPSRSSFLAGSYPHNTKYVVNGGAWSMANWTKRENDTLGSWLGDAGYYSAFLGKYINGLEPRTPPFGWNHWGGLI